MELNKELLEKAKTATSAEELLALVKENEVEMTEESAKAYFELMQAQTKTGELSDEELDNVAGGGCHQGDGRMITTVANSCEHFCCKYCGSGRKIVHREAFGTKPECANDFCRMRSAWCEHCEHMSYESGLWLCNHPANRE